MDDIRTLRNKMQFYAYKAGNLDEIETLFANRFQRKPDAFMVRSPFGITGRTANLKKLVVSQKHCGNNAVFVPLHLNKSELENAILALGEVHHMIYADRRKLEKAAEIAEINQENERRTYSRHCTYCGKKYITNTVRPDPHCGNSLCNLRHQEHLELQRELRNLSREKATKAVVSVSSTPTIVEMDDPTTNTLQGYVYCIRAENGLCKIGRSSNVENRFSTVVGASPVAVYLEHTVFSNNYVLAESTAHNELARYRHHGEWFDLPEDVFNWFLALDNYDLDDA